jgi:hypothetical protein
VFVLYILCKKLQRLVKEYKKVDRRSPLEIDLDNMHEGIKAKQKEIKLLLKRQERYALVETNGYKFSLYDTTKELLMTNLSFKEAKYILSL